MSTGAEPEPAVSPGRARYVLGLLLAVNTFNFIDRNLPAVLAPRIQADLALSDEQLGLLFGAAFVLVHAAFGIPFARAADHGTRRTIVAAGLGVWSLLTALSGLARSWWQLVALRMGVGIGEAANTPAAHSLISDCFPPSRRGRAMSVYAMGVYLGIMFGYLAAGWLGEVLGWRLTFVAVGVPGLLLALLIRLTVAEPPRTTRVTAHPIGEVVRFLAGQRAYLALLLAASFHAGFGYAVAGWMPTFLHRVHDMSLAEVGMALGPITGLLGGLGALAGGAAADRLGVHDRRWYAWIPAVAAFGALPFGAAAFLGTSARGSLACFAPYIFMSGLYTGPLYAMNQGLARPRMRAMSVAVHLFVVSIVGGAIGPWAVGRLSDALSAQHGADGVRYGLLAVLGVGAVVAGAAYLLAARTLDRDLHAAAE